MTDITLDRVTYRYTKQGEWIGGGLVIHRLIDGRYVAWMTGPRTKCADTFAAVVADILYGA